MDLGISCPYTSVRIAIGNQYTQPLGEIVSVSTLFFEVELGRIELAEPHRHGHSLTVSINTTQRVIAENSRSFTLFIRSALYQMRSNNSGL